MANIDDDKRLVEWIRGDMSDMKRDISGSLSQLHGKIDLMSQTFVTKSEHKEKYDHLEKHVEKKLDHDDFKEWVKNRFDPQSSILTRVNVIIITAVVTGLLALILRK